MTKEKAKEIRAKMKRYGIKHYIYGGLFQTVHGLRKDRFDCGYCCYSDEEFESKSKELYKHGYETLFAVHEA